MPPIRWRRALLPAGLCLAIFAAGCDDDELPPPVSVASLAERQGPVTVERAGAALDPQPPAPLYLGDTVATGEGARALIRYTDGTEIQVSPNTRFRLGGVPGKLTLELDEGSIVSNARAGGAGGLSIITRFGTAAIVQGSQVEFDLSAEGGSMDVAFGEITVLDADGGTRTIVAGQTFNLDLAGEEAADAGTALAEGPRALELTLASSRATALKAKGARRFSPAPKQAAPLVAGTELQVRRGGEALVSGPNVGLRFESGTSAVVGEASSLGGVDRYALTMSGGEADIRVAPGGTRELALEGRGRSLVLRAAEEAQAVAVQTPKASRVQVLTGRMEIEAGGQKHTLSPGDRLVLTGGKAQVVPADRPLLVVPHSRRVRVYADRLDELGLAIPAGDPRVEVARDGEFKQVLVSGQAHGEVLAVPVEVPGELHWRAFGPGGEVIATGQARLMRDAGRSAVDLTNPHAEVAETGLNATVLFQSAPPSLSFSFAANDQAASYRVRVYRAGDLKTPVAEKVVQEASCTFEAGKIPEGSYVWYAAPLDANGVELAGGRMNKLDMVYDNSRTSLAIARPRQNDVVPAGGVPVEGVAPLGARLFVNGKVAPVDPKGRFALQVPRSDTVVFRVVGENGVESYWLRQLRRRR